MREDVRRRAERLALDLRGIFGDRLRALVLYGAHAAGPDLDGSSVPEAAIETMALVERLELADLEGCARLHRAWTRQGLATPLLLGADDFSRSLDAFPIELGAIMARHEVVVGSDPFAGMAVRRDDLRRACEIQARSHLLHLREGFIEAGGDPSGIAELVRSSASALHALLANVARLDGNDSGDAETTLGAAALAQRASRLTGAPASVFGDVLALQSATLGVDVARLFPPYLAAMEGLARVIDRRGVA